MTTGKTEEPFWAEMHKQAAAHPTQLARLEREVIASCSAYCQSVLDIEEHGYPEGVPVNDWHGQHCERQTAMIDAYKALQSFEAEQSKGQTNGT